MLNALIVALLLGAFPQTGGAPAQPAAKPDERARELDIRYQLLCEQYTRTETEWSEQLKRMAAYPEQRAQLLGKHPVKDYWERFETLVKDGEAHAMLWLVGHADKMFAEKAEVGQRKQALLQKLIEEHASASWGKEIPVAISLQRHWLDIKGVDDLLEAFAKKTTNREFAAEALSRAMALYVSLSVRGEGRERAAALSERLLNEYADTEAGRICFEQICNRETNQLVNQPGAPIAGKDVDGAEIELAALRGKVVLLVFWSAADARTPALLQTLRELSGRHAEDPFVVLGVSSDEDAARFREFVKAQDVRWRSVWEGRRLGPLAQSYRVRALPTLFVIDGAGIIRQSWVGLCDTKTLDLRIEPTIAPLRTGR